MDYALIENGIVTNIIFLLPTNADDFPGAVPIGDIPVGIGDTYENGDFYRDGEVLKSSLEMTNERVAMVEEALEILLSGKTEENEVTGEVD